MIFFFKILWLQVIDLMCGISTRWCSVVLWFLWLYWNLWWTNTSMKNWLQNDVAIVQWTLNTFSDNVHEWIKWKCASSCIKKNYYLRILPVLLQFMTCARTKCPDQRFCSVYWVTEEMLSSPSKLRFFQFKCFQQFFFKFSKTVFKSLPNARRAN